MFQLSLFRGSAELWILYEEYEAAYFPKGSNIKPSMIVTEKGTQVCPLSFSPISVVLCDFLTAFFCEFYFRKLAKTTLSRGRVEAGQQKVRNESGFVFRVELRTTLWSGTMIFWRSKTRSCWTSPRVSARSQAHPQTC